MNFFQRKSLQSWGIFLSVLSVCIALSYYALHVELPQKSKPFLLYSNQSRDDARLLFKKAFQKAEKSIALNMYTLTDPVLIRQLEKESLQGKKISVCFDPKAGNPSIKKDIERTPVRAAGIMHKKIVVIDSALCFLGSTNMTTSSLLLHDNLTIGLYSPSLAAFLLEHERDKPISKKEIKKSHPSTPHLHFFCNQVEMDCYLLPDYSGIALAHLISSIKEAKKSIFVAMFTLTQPLLVEQLIEAHKKGIKVEVLCDLYSCKGASSKAYKTLKEAGVYIKPSQGGKLLHHKWAFIDGQKLILGSTNWTKAAFTQNQDLLLFIHNLPEKQRQKMEKIASTVKASRLPSSYF